MRLRRFARNDIPLPVNAVDCHCEERSDRQYLSRAITHRNYAAKPSALLIFKGLSDRVRKYGPGSLDTPLRPVGAGVSACPLKEGRRAGTARPVAIS